MKLTNNFHNTETTIRVRKDGTISAQALRRARRILCMADCRCSNEAGERPNRHTFYPIYSDDNMAVVAYQVEDNI